MDTSQAMYTHCNAIVVSSDQLDDWIARAHAGEQKS
jgi:hypothetical protein